MSAASPGVSWLGPVFGFAVVIAVAGCAASPTPEPAAPAEAPATAPAEPEASADLPTASDDAYRAPRSFEDVPVEEAMALLAREGRVDIDYRDPGHDPRITVRCPGEEPWEDVLRSVADAAGLDVEKRSDRLYVVRRGPRVTAEFREIPIHDAVLIIAQQTGTSIIVGQGVEGEVTLNLRDVPVREALEAIAKTGGYTVVREPTGWSLNRSGQP